jgi:hypothetical protein
VKSWTASSLALKFSISLLSALFSEIRKKRKQMMIKTSIPTQIYKMYADLSVNWPRVKF